MQHIESMRLRSEMMPQEAGYTTTQEVAGLRTDVAEFRSARLVGVPRFRQSREPEPVGESAQQKQPG